MLRLKTYFDTKLPHFMKVEDMKVDLMNYIPLLLIIWNLVYTCEKLFDA